MVVTFLINMIKFKRNCLLMTPSVKNMQERKKAQKEEVCCDQRSATS